MLYVMLRPALAAAQTKPQTRLLLLGVFGFGRRSRRLLDLLGARWRLIGSIDLIAVPDLASSTVEPSTFIEFIRGRLVRLFIRTPEQSRTGWRRSISGPTPTRAFGSISRFAATQCGAAP